MSEPPPYPDRFPSPWWIEESGEAFIVKDGNRFPVAYIYYTRRPLVGTKSERPTRDRAWQLARQIAKLPGLLGR